MKGICIIIILILVIFGCGITAYTASNSNDTENTFVSEKNNDLSEYIVEDNVVSESAAEINDKSNGDIDVLSKAYSMMEKAEFNDTTYSWREEFYASKPDFRDGVLSGKIADFDNDGKFELLVLKLLNSNENNENSVKYANVKMEMYEIEKNAVKVGAETDSFTVIDSRTDAGGLECFVKNNYIVLECASQNNTFGDGATQSINVYSYNGNAFVNEVKSSFSGSSIRFDDDSIAKKFRELGFNEISDYFENKMISPYFITSDFDTSIWNFSGCTNLAKIENNIDQVLELLITNNTNELINENQNVTDWNSFFVENAVMKIEVNDYSNLD